MTDYNSQSSDSFFFKLVQGWLADRLLFFYECCFDLIYNMGPKKQERM